MCDLSVLYKENGIEEGIEIGKMQGIEIGKMQGIEIGKMQGIEIGIEQGLEREKEHSIRNIILILKDMNIPPKNIAERLETIYNLSPEQCESYLNDMNVNQ